MICFVVILLYAWVIIVCVHGFTIGLYECVRAFSLIQLAFVCTVFGALYAMFTIYV